MEKYCEGFDISIAEFSINDNINTIYSDLLDKNADIYCFSCYIWNIEQTLKVASMLKSAMPRGIVIFGGPECSYNALETMSKYSFVDYIIMGEGEQTLNELLFALKDNLDASNIIGTASRNTINPIRKAMDLSTVKQPYTKNDIISLQDKIIYFETSRGCPFACSYCLSSIDRKVRNFPMDYVKQGLGLLLKMNVPLVKLIDRTFNCDPSRAIEIIRFIMENSQNTCVHFEVAPQLLNYEIINILKSAPKNMFQLEMGIQSANTKTLDAIGRKCDLQKAKNNILKLQQAGNIHLHLDLIAGLPYEDYSSFAKSFDFVYSLKPDMLQLGFLKVLHGTSIKAENSICHSPFAPYEVIYTNWLTPQELCKLKEIENAVDRFYNSNAFSRTIELLTQKSPFVEFEKLAAILKEAEKHGSLNRAKLYELLYNHYGDEILEGLIFDFLQNNKNLALPSFAKGTQSHKFKEKCYALLKDSTFLEKYNVKPNLKNIRFEEVMDKVILIDYVNNNIFDITDFYKLQ